MLDQRKQNIMLDDAKLINIDAVSRDHEVSALEQRQVAPPVFLVVSMEAGLNNDLHE